MTVLPEIMGRQYGTVSLERKEVWEGMDRLEEKTQ